MNLRPVVSFAMVVLWAGCFVACSGPEVATEGCLPSPAPVCGQPCTNPCGCSAPVSAMCFAGDRLARPEGSCLRVQQVCSPGACIDDGSSLTNDARCATTCSDVKLAYALAGRRAGALGAVSTRPPIQPGAYNGSSSCEPDSCVVIPGHCELGLDLCWYLGPHIEELEQLSRMYVELGCPADSTCDCQAPPVNVSCETSNTGFEVWGRSGTFSHACVVR